MALWHVSLVFFSVPEPVEMLAPFLHFYGFSIRLLRTFLHALYNTGEVNGVALLQSGYTVT